MMILLNPATGLAVNPQAISFIIVVQDDGVNGLMPRLVITMKSGYELHISHRPDAGIDVEALHAQLLEVV